MRLTGPDSDTINNATTTNRKAFKFVSRSLAGGIGATNEGAAGSDVDGVLGSSASRPCAVQQLAVGYTFYRSLVPFWVGTSWFWVET